VQLLKLALIISQSNWQVGFKMNYYLFQAQRLAKLAIEQKDQLLFDIAKSNLLMYYKLKKEQTTNAA